MLDFFYLLLFIFLLTGLSIKRNTFINLEIIKLNLYDIYIYILIFLVASAFRYNIGTDFIHYRFAYTYMSNGFYPTWMNFEPGFIFLNEFLILFFDHSQTIIIVTSFITIGLFFFIFKKYSTDALQSIFLFYTLYFYFMSFNLVRQFLAIGIILLAFQMLLQKRKTLYFALVLVASMFHTTSLVVIPFFFFQKVNMSISKIVLALVALIGLYTPFLNLFLSLFPKYENYVYSEGGTSILNIAFIILELCMFLYIKYTKRVDEVSKYYLNVFLAAAVSALFVSALSVRILYFARLSYYFYAICLLAVPYGWKLLSGRKMFYFFKFSMILLSIFIFFYYLSNNVGGVSPYQFWNFVD